MSPGARKYALAAHLTCTLWLVAWFVIVPLAHGALATGLIQALGTDWGLFRHYWVAAKLVLTLLALAILVLKMPPISSLAASQNGFGSSDFVGLRRSVAVHAAGGIVVLAAVTGLAVFKPAGLIGADVPRWVKIFGILAIALVLMLAIMMLFGSHGPRAHM